jgi:phosphoribosylformylglycinamidine cyclo-ligase
MSKYISYEQSGVSIDGGDKIAQRIRSYISRTYDPRVISIADGFAGLFRLDYEEAHPLLKKRYRKPVLVACADGVGTKVKLAHMVNRFDTVGIDLVAMNVNDMLAQGAKPLFFLDYLAVGKLEPRKIAEMIKGISAGCKEADCSVLGGETAEMPDIYRKGEFDMGGFAVGIVEEKKIVDGRNVRKGDYILGLASSGLHSNGYTLVRNICFKRARFRMTDTPDELDGATLGDVLLEPTRIYVNSIIDLLKQYKVKRVVHGMAHITGGGLVGNIPRVLPKDCDAAIKKSSWPKQKIFTFLQKTGPIEEDEMFRVFNMGIGFVLIVSEDFADSIVKKLTRYGEQVYKIGRITTGTGKVTLK